MMDENPALTPQTTWCVGWLFPNDWRLDNRWPFHHLLYVVTGISALLVLLQAIMAGFPRTLATRQAHCFELPNLDCLRSRIRRAVPKLIQGHGPVIFAFRVAHFLGNFILLSLSLIGPDGFSVYPPRLSSRDSLAIQSSLAYLYTTILSSTALITTGRLSLVAVRHVNSVLLVTLVAYLHRDIWPLATYTQHRLESGLFVWVHLAVLSFTSIVIPISIPRDSGKNSQLINREQTASYLSLATFSFLNSLIIGASRLQRIAVEDLPPLCDEDRSDYLKQRAFPLLDTYKNAMERPKIVLRLLNIFRWDFCGMAICLIGRTLASFAAPISINQVIAYLEEGNTSSTIRPWVWVSLLFVGPLSVSLFLQRYAFIAGKVSVRAQAILTQLVYEQSLRIRVNTETSNATAKQDETEEPQPKANLVGKLNTLVTIDMENIVSAKEFLMVFVEMPLELALAISFLYIVLGWSAFVGLGCMMALSPIPGDIASKMQIISKKRLEKARETNITDARIEAVTELIGKLRMIKLFGWGKKMMEKLEVIREDELKWIFRDKMTTLMNNVVNYFIPILTMLATFGSYTLIEKQLLTPSKVFSSMAVISIIRNLLHQTSWAVGNIMRAKVSLERVEDFLHNTDVLDAYALDRDVHTYEEHADEIGFKDAMFQWSSSSSDDRTSLSPQGFKLRVDGRLTFKRNAINLITGPTGCGKTSLFMALLGEMHFLQLGDSSWYNLPREGGIALAVQESWVLNANIRENNLFGCPFDEERYRRVIYQCSLEQDLALFTAGDQTEVGEQGITLSGGQKARVTLARAVYSQAQTVLLDDILAQLDVHTATHVLKECLRGDLLRGRTVLLISHNIAITSPIAEKSIAIDASGNVREIEHVKNLVEQENGTPRVTQGETPASRTEKSSLYAVKEPSGGQNDVQGTLVFSEKVETGKVSWSSMRLFFSALDGKSPTLFFVPWILGVVLMHASTTMALWYLGVWSTQYETGDSSQVQDAHYLGTYAAILASGVLIYIAAATIFHRGSQRASRFIHSQLIGSILIATFRWLDETPSSRVIARCTQDIGAIDIALAWAVYRLAELGIFMLLKLATPTIFSPIFVVPTIAALTLGWYLGSVYLKTKLPVTRELGKASAPILAHCIATLNGLACIRAYGAQEDFKLQSLKLLDHRSRLSRTSLNLNWWITLRSDFIGATLPALLAAYLIATKRTTSANTGFLLATSAEFGSSILWLVRSWNDLEVISNSLERIRAYLHISHERQGTKLHNLPASWPQSGDLDVRNLSARYSEDGPEILHKLSFHVPAGERIGIIGRTGSGKSSLTLSLLQCIFTEGEIIYDGIRIDGLDLDTLRSNMTIIPQVPELLRGTLRRNLDPFEEHDDMTLHHALRDAGLSSLQSGSERAQLSLDSNITSGGDNLSAGQRQIIALARALVRGTKVLILDEATSFIDHETDYAIQKSLRQHAASGFTVLTVAHRLRNVMDADKVMVLDEGRIIEYDSPSVLLQKDGPFKGMVDASEDKATLYSLAQEKKFEK